MISNKEKNYALVANKVNKYFVDQENNKFIDMFKSQDMKKMFHSVKDISFKVDRNSIFGVLGPNGCGKSTLIRMMSTLIIPDTGTLEMFGVNVEENPFKIKDLIGRVSVDASFFMKLSAIENLNYAAGLYGLDSLTARQRSESLLNELGFPKSKFDISVEKLSRGQQQKIAIARGFLSKPKLLLLDEPTTGLDPVSKLDVQKFIKRIIKEEDVTIIITSHDMEEIDKLCDKMVIMDEGKIIAKGTSKALKKKFGEENLFELKTNDVMKTKSLLNEIDGVENVRLVITEKKEKKLVMNIDNIDIVSSKIVEGLQNYSIGLQGLSKVTPSLEDVFVKLTGKTLVNTGVG